MSQMMQSQLIARIKGRKNGLSPVLKKIAEFVISEAQKVSEFTLMELANATATSEASIIRFCRDMEFTSYSAFKLSLSLDLLKNEQQASEQEAGNGIGSSLKLTISSLQDTAALLDVSVVNSAAKSMREAGCIYFFGVGASSTIAKYGEYRMVRLGLRTRALSDVHDAIMTTACIKKEDTIVLISGSGQTLDVIKVGIQAKSNGCSIIAITGNDFSDLARLATHCLQTSVNEQPPSAGAFFSKAAQMFVIDLLANDILEENSELKASVEKTAESALSGGSHLI